MGEGVEKEWRVRRDWGVRKVSVVGSRVRVWKK